MKEHNNRKKANKFAEYITGSELRKYTAEKVKKYCGNNPSVFDGAGGSGQLEQFIQPFVFTAVEIQNEWSLRCTGDMDLIVAFLEREEGSELDEPIIAIIPKAVFPREKIEIHKNGKYQKLFINKNELIELLDKYQSLKMAIGNI